MVGVGLGLGSGRHRLTGILRQVRLDERVGDGRPGRHGDLLLGQLVVHVAVGEGAGPDEQAGRDEQNHGDEGSASGEKRVESPAAHGVLLKLWSDGGPACAVVLISPRWSRANRRSRDEGPDFARRPGAGAYHQGMPIPADPNQPAPTPATTPGPWPAARALDLDDLLDELRSRASSALRSQERLRDLLTAVVSVTTDLELAEVLGRIVDSAIALVDARYAALGVLSGDGTYLTEFITPGCDRGAARADRGAPERAGRARAADPAPAPAARRRHHDAP